MTIPEHFLIEDIRQPIDFQLSTFSGYKKLDVFKALFKAIDEYKIEETCHWTIELILSCQAHILYEKFIIYMCKYINVLNPNLSDLFVERYSYYKSLNIHPKEAINNQCIRNHLTEMALCLALSSKTKFHSLPKINSNDFVNEHLIKKFKAQNQSVINNYSQKNDPVELNIIINELWDRISKQNVKEALFFLNWIIHYEKKKGGKVECAERQVEGLSKRYYTDFTIYIWQVITNQTHDSQLKTIVNNLFQLSLFQFTKTRCLQLIVCAIKILTEKTLDKTKQILPFRTTLIQAVAKVNFIVLSKKKYEVVKKKNIVQFAKEEKKESKKEPQEEHQDKKMSLVFALDTGVY
jgi:hypothetical protein